MGEKIVVGPVNKGLRNDRPPFMIDNDSFPTLINAYQWRGRLKRKRGTSFLARLTRYFDSTISSYNPGSTTITLDGSGAGNLLTGFTALQTNASVVPGSVTITDTSNANELYTDPSENGTLIGSTGGTGTINYATGAFTITGGAGHVVNAKFNYYPNLPVMGLEDFISVLTEYPGTIGFDTTYAYNFLTGFPYSTYNISFYKNPPVTAAFPGYVPKTTPTPFNWNGQNYQQFWTTNYQGALWATNGITVPFSTTNIGMQFQKPSSATWVNATTINFVIAASPLIVGDFVFTNEWSSAAMVTPPNSILFNMLTGYVTAVAGTTYTVVFPNAAIPSDTYSNGILQYLTNVSDGTKDCIRWYDGDPTSGNPAVPALTGHLGWVNFMPPLSDFNIGTYSIADLPASTYYLVGARMIFPFKDRLIFFGPVIQTSSPGSQVYLKDTIIYSQNGTPYYTSTFTADPSLATTTFFPVLVPTAQTATANAWWENQTGFGGFLSAAIDQDIISLGINEDVLIVEFSRSMARLIATGNDLLPFGFFAINAEWGTIGTFSSVTMDQGVISIGSRGFVITSQTSSQRIDLEIPDNVFEIGLQNNGAERICSQRDFINEWIYFTYVPDIDDDEAVTSDIYPSQTLQYNYREQTWAVFNESYTTYGTFRKLAGFTWATVGFEFATWTEWNEPWNAGVASQLQPEVIGGTSQGFVVIRDQGTGESISRYIKDISGILVTSPGHSFDNGDYIIISGCLGTVSSEVNEKIFGVQYVSQDQFNLIPTTPMSSGLTYLGGGVITKMYMPFIQSKQFPLAWADARKTRLGPQQYLLTKTANSQITLLIFLSTDATTPYNYIGFPLAPNNILPAANSPNDSLVYSATLYTCPESTNLGLTPANINLQSLTAISQNQIWHRMNTSLIGDTIQIGFSLSDAQMRSLDPVGAPLTITGATNAYPCVLTVLGQPEADQLLYITGVQGMTQLNSSPNTNPPSFNLYNIISSTSTTITIDVDSTGFGTYTSGGSLQIVGPQNQFAEIEIMGFILDVSPSMLLA
jgi:hypothetical protein